MCVSKSTRTMAQHRFIILVGDAQAFPGRLVAGLDGRNVKVVTVFDAPWVMAELTEDTHTLIVTEPARIRQLRDLIEAVRAYFPAVRLWQYGREVEGEPAPVLEPMFGGNAKRTIATPTKGQPRPVVPSPGGTGQTPVPPVTPKVAPSAVAPVEPAAVPSQSDRGDRDVFTVPPPPSDVDEAAGDGAYTVFANTAAAGSDQELSDVAEEQFRNMLSQVHAQVLRSPLPFMAPGEPDAHTPLISPEELAMLIGPIPDREEDADTYNRQQGRKERTS
jgi:hypothetical protein